MRTRIKNQLQHIALNQGWQKKRKLWSEAGLKLLRSLALEPWTGQRRDTLLEMLQELQEKIRPLDQAVEKEAYACTAARRFATHPGVGPVISLATVLTMGDGKPFAYSRSWASYLVLNPSEESSGQGRRLGAINKQGNPFLRYLLVEGAASAVRGHKSLARLYARLKAKKHHGVAKVAVARKLAARLYWMARTEKSYPEGVRTQGSQSHPVAAVVAGQLNRPPGSHQKGPRLVYTIDESALGEFHFNFLCCWIELGDSETADLSSVNVRDLGGNVPRTSTFPSRLQHRAERR